VWRTPLPLFHYLACSESIESDLPTSPCHCASYRTRSPGWRPWLRARRAVGPSWSVPSAPECTRSRAPDSAPAAPFAPAPKWCTDCSAGSGAAFRARTRRRGRPAWCGSRAKGWGPCQRWRPGSGAGRVCFWRVVRQPASPAASRRCLSVLRWLSDCWKLNS